MAKGREIYNRASEKAPIKLMTQVQVKLKSDISETSRID
jgi:hypothetical protein